MRVFARNGGVSQEEMKKASPRGRRQSRLRATGTPTALSYRQRPKWAPRASVSKRRRTRIWLCLFGVVGLLVCR
jgi:hypothetical protein